MGKEMLMFNNIEIEKKITTIGLLYFGRCRY